jgi:uncharacterized protein (DUF58 family)
MTLASTGYSKAAYAATLAATLAYFLERQGDATGLLTFDEKVRDYLPARHRVGHLRRLMLALEAPAAGNATDLISPLQRVAEIVRKRGLIVLISDLLATKERLERSLNVLSAAGHEVIVFQVLDPIELSLAYEQPSWFEDIETGRTVFVDPAAVRARYRERLEAHTDELRTICQRLGAGWHRLVTNEPLEHALFAFLRDRNRRGRGVRRFSPTGGRLTS